MPRAECPGCGEIERVAMVWAGQGWCSPECIIEAEPQDDQD